MRVALFSPDAARAQRDRRLHARPGRGADRRHARSIVFVATADEVDAARDDGSAGSIRDGARLPLASPPRALRRDRLPDGQLVVPRLHVALPLPVSGPRRAPRRPPAPRACLVAAAAPARWTTTARSWRSTTRTLPQEAAEAALAGFGGTLYYFWPMLRSVVTSARAVAVHNAPLADDIRGAFPAVDVHEIRMGVPVVAPRPDEVAAVRRPSRHRADHAGSGGLRGRHAGEAPPPGVRGRGRRSPVPSRPARAPRRPDASALRRHGGRAVGRSRRPGHDRRATVDDAELPAYLAAADIVSCLRFPSARETSASWLRALAAGRPTFVTDLAQQASLPTLDPRSWTVTSCHPRRLSRADGHQHRPAGRSPLADARR